MLKLTQKEILDDVLNLGKQASNSSGRVKEVTVVGASKSQPQQKLEDAIASGIKVFGENKVQETLDKWPMLKLKYPHIQLHLIGPLQSNKAKEAVSLFDCIQSLDREKIADAIASECRKLHKRMPCFIQVNIGKEPQKAGVKPEMLDALYSHCKQFEEVEIIGLMGIPPANKPPAPYFALLRQYQEKLKLPFLSMGMSQDYREAIAFGATHVRIGTALFGERSV